MNHCAIQQQNVYAAREEMRSPVSIPMSDRRDSVVCPKPRRMGFLDSTINDPIRPLRWHLSHHQSEYSDSRAGTDLLDIILSKGGYSVEQSGNQLASSPPFFSGSPPSRVANPVVLDARFGDEKITPSAPLQPVPSPGPSSSPSSSARKGGCLRANYGSKPVVRIEGFDCLDRDRRNCSIPALA